LLSVLGVDSPSHNDTAIEHRLNLLFQKTRCDTFLASSGVRMIRKYFFSAVIVILMAFCQASPAHTAAPEEQLVDAVKVALGRNFNTDWSGLDALPGIKWAPLPPASLQNCLPDGGCFARQGAARFGDHSLTVIASGARTIVTNIYFRSTARALGETNVLDALKHAGFAPELARCPVQGTIGGTNWYRLQSASFNPGVLSVQSSCNGKPCEGFQLTLGGDCRNCNRARFLCTRNAVPALRKLAARFRRRALRS
jgi:hypothetical protein